MTLESTIRGMQVITEASKYDLYHKDFSSAMQYAYKAAKKMYGITIDPDEIDSKVATGPKKPSEGKTNKYRLKGDKGSIQIQVYNKGGSKPFELNMYKEEVEVEVDEEWTIVMPPAEGGKTITGLDSMQAWSFIKSKGGHKRDMQSIKKGKSVTFQGKTGAFYKVIKEGLGVAEEVDLDEGGMKDLLIRAQELMGPSKNRKEGIQMVAKGLKVSEKEATKLVDAAIKMNEELAKIKGNTPADKGRKSAVEDDIERAEKKGDKKEVEKLKEVDLDEKEYKVTNDKLGVWTGPAHSEEDAKEKALKKWSVVGNVEFTKDTTVEIIEEEDLDEGKMSQLHQYIKDKKSAEEIAKLMKVDVATIKKLMSSYNVEDVEEGAAADARRAMKKDKDLKRKKDSADVDDFATDDDVKAASKNIIMQMRKAVSMKGDFTVEFGDKKKVKIPVKIAQAVQQKYNSMKKPADKEKFQVQVAKSYKDMLRVLKAGYGEQKESILDRIDKKLKERKNG